MNLGEHTKYFILIHGKKSSDTARYSVSRNSKSSNARISSIVTLSSLSLSALSTRFFTRWLASVSSWVSVGKLKLRRIKKASHLIQKHFQGKPVVPGDLKRVSGLVEELKNLVDVNFAISTWPLAVDQSEEPGHEVQCFRFRQSFVSVSVQLRWWVMRKIVFAEVFSP